MSRLSAPLITTPALFIPAIAIIEIGTTYGLPLGFGVAGCLVLVSVGILSLRRRHHVGRPQFRFWVSLAVTDCQRLYLTGDFFATKSQLALVGTHFTDAVFRRNVLGS